MIPAPLPVGISRVMLRPGRRPAARALPFFNANVGWRGRRFARHFSIDRLGEDVTFAAALEWRRTMVASLTGSGRAHRKFNLPGKRRSSIS